MSESDGIRLARSAADSYRKLLNMWNKHLNYFLIHDLWAIFRLRFVIGFLLKCYSKEAYRITSWHDNEAISNEICASFTRLSSGNIERYLIMDKISSHNRLMIWYPDECRAQSEEHSCFYVWTVDSAKHFTAEHSYENCVCFLSFKQQSTSTKASSSRSHSPWRHAGANLTEIIRPTVTLMGECLHNNISIKLKLMLNSL